MKHKLSSLVAALLLVLPLAARADDGYTVANVDMVAGPDPQYPAIMPLGAGTPVSVQGCTEGWQWCDVVAEGNRGWIPGSYIEFMYDEQPVYVTDYGARVGIPIVTFAIGTYWGRYYANRPFYRERDRWYSRPLPIRPPPGPRPPIRPWPGGQRPGDHRPPPRPGNEHRPPPGGYHPQHPVGDHRPPPAGHQPRPPARPQPPIDTPHPQPPAGRPMPPAGGYPARPAGGEHPLPPAGAHPAQPAHGNHPAPPHGSGARPAPSRNGDHDHGG